MDLVNTWSAFSGAASSAPRLHPVLQLGPSLPQRRPRCGWQLVHCWQSWCCTVCEKSSTEPVCQRKTQPGSPCLYKRVTLQSQLRFVQTPAADHLECGALPHQELSRSRGLLDEPGAFSRQLSSATAVCTPCRGPRRQRSNQINVCQL